MLNHDTTLYVTASHPISGLGFNREPVRVAVRHYPHGVECWATHPSLGCGKTFLTPMAALRGLLADHALTLVSVRADADGPELSGDDMVVSPPPAAAYAPRPMRILSYRTTGDAYDALQSPRLDPTIHNGDVFVIHKVNDDGVNESVVGFALEAWPVAVTKRCGAFHMAKPTIDWSRVPITGRKGVFFDYRQSVAVAKAMARFIGADINPDLEVPTSDLISVINELLPLAVLAEERLRGKANCKAAADDCARVVALARDALAKGA